MKTPGPYNMMQQSGKNQTMQESFHKITSRHIARCLTNLESVNVPAMVNDTIKRELWYLSNDLKDLVMRGQNNEENTNSNR